MSDTRAASARRSTPSAPSTRRRCRRGGMGGGARDASLHAHVSEQPQENARHVGRLRLTPRRAPRHAGRGRAGASPPSTPPTSTATTSPPWRQRERAAASARRPNATSPTGSVRRRRCAAPASPSASARTPTPSSTRSRRSAPSSSTHAWPRRAAATTTGGAVGDRPRQPVTAASVGPTAGVFAPARLADFVTVGSGQPAPGRLRRSSCRSAPSCSPPPLSTSATW